MKTAPLLISILLLAGCTTDEADDRNWTKAVAQDYNAGKIEYLDLNGLLMEWSASAKGKGWLYFSRPKTNDKVWTFPGRAATGRHKNAISVEDGEVVTAVHESGRSFEIRVITQTKESAVVMYTEI